MNNVERAKCPNCGHAVFTVTRALEPEPQVLAVLRCVRCLIDLEMRSLPSVIWERELPF